MLWLFQVFALTAGLYVLCQVWATFSLTNDSSKITLHTSFISAGPENTPGCQETLKVLLLTACFAK